MSAGGERRRRMILLKFKPDVPQEQREALLEEIHENFSEMEGLSELEVGPQTADLCDFTHALTFVLEDDAALRTYREDVRHRSLRANHFELMESTVTAEIHVD